MSQSKMWNLKQETTVPYSITGCLRELSLMHLLCCAHRSEKTSKAKPVFAEAFPFCRALKDKFLPNMFFSNTEDSWNFTNTLYN